MTADAPPITPAERAALDILESLVASSERHGVPVFSTSAATLRPVLALVRRVTLMEEFLGDLEHPPRSRERQLFDASADLAACRERCEWLMTAEADCRAAITEALSALDREQKAHTAATARIAELEGLLLAALDTR